MNSLDTLPNFHIKSVPGWTPLAFHRVEVKILRQVTVYAKPAVPILIFEALAAICSLVVLLVAQALYAFFPLRIKMRVIGTWVAAVARKVWLLLWTAAALLAYHVVDLALRTWQALLLHYVEIHWEKTLHAPMAVPEIIGAAFAYFLLLVVNHWVLAFYTLAYCLIKVRAVHAFCA